MPREPNTLNYIIYLTFYRDPVYDLWHIPYLRGFGFRVSGLVLGSLSDWSVLSLGKKSQACRARLFAISTWVLGDPF